MILRKSPISIYGMLGNMFHCCITTNKNSNKKANSELAIYCVSKIVAFIFFLCFKTNKNVLTRNAPN